MWQPSQVGTNAFSVMRSESVKIPVLEEQGAAFFTVIRLLHPMSFQTEPGFICSLQVLTRFKNNVSTAGEMFVSLLYQLNGLHLNSQNAANSVEYE